ncbi:hypothetical protein KPH14_010619 [Odynerus spinipes]|uniref:Uncharacterized protein n=1 Tax=Odynerus spinipes TaxID=1348599 RepID=A0AAD9RV13_9HYME|nr:hypothetical protein KPH14_010619 [Odynerus spinipes]
MEIRNRKEEKKRNIYRNNRIPWFGSRKLSKEVVAWIARARANLCNLDASLAETKFISYPTCPCDCLEQNLDHMLWECVLYRKERTELVENLWKKKWKPPFRIDLLKVPELESLKCVHCFILGHKLFI